MDLVTFDVSAVDPALARPGDDDRAARRRLRRRRGRRRCRHDRLRDPDRARRAAITASIATPPDSRRMIGVSRVDRRGLPRLSRRRPAGSRCSPGGRSRPRLTPALLPAPDPAPDRQYRLFLAAGRRADRDLHRHGAGAAILYRVQPLQRRERGRHRRRAVGDARAGAGHRRADGRRPRRRGDGGRDRHDARHRADRRADDAVDRPAALSGAAAPAGRADDPAGAGAGRRHHRRVRRLSRRHLQARLQPGQLPDPDRAAISRRWMSSRASSRRRCSASSSR